MARTSNMMKLNWVCFILVLSISLSVGTIQENRQLYIVYMGSLPGGSYQPTSHHLDILQSVVANTSLLPQVLQRSYHRSFNGFAAWLTEQEREKLSGMKEISSVFRSQTLQLHTTRSWDFLGFTNNVTRKPTIESDMVIGVLDTGVWPESESFSDAGLGPIPKKWKGACNGGSNFTCNRKIIGARIYEEGGSARDTEGHGTHTASTAAGNIVKGASYYGIAEGTARGGVPSARIATYQVCNTGGCGADSILAGFDDAIADGVDIISTSLGNSYQVDFVEDVIAIGSFHAMSKNVLTSNAAGNSGFQGAYTIFNLAPWTISVGASTTDRKIVDKVVLGDGTNITGISINHFSLKREPKYPLVYGQKFGSKCQDELHISCDVECLSEDFLKGKIVMCESDESKTLPGTISPTGVITLSESNFSYVPQLPALALNTPKFEQVATYAQTKEPHATILKSETVKDNLAPVVAPFSSRGPNSLFPDIMKPDVVAPGVDILAAFPPKDGPYQYYFDSGTSMSCPHVSGAAAYVKSFHLGWSPAAIKSALMTTARPLKESAHPDREFAYGSGQIDPVKAANPGLIFNISKDDYVHLICSAYDAETCKKISGQDCRCPKAKIALKDVNYPSLTAKINGTKTIKMSFTRVATNVGRSKSIYKSSIKADPSLKISVAPSTLSFTVLNQKKSFVVSVTGAFSGQEEILSSSLVWNDGIHTVRIPIILYR